MREISTIFLDSVLENTERLIGGLNRNQSSKTYGSFDRSFWHYRTNDISSARYQEAVLTLALLYKNQFEGNKYYKNKEVLKWINAALSFTILIQRRDGSFDEWYINEGSYVATSFVAVAISETLLLLGGEVDRHEKITEMLKNACDWIIAHEEETVFNQLAGSVFALENVYKLTGEKVYKKGALEKLDKILKSQSKEGWWHEYGGPDIGYLSLMIHYLASYYNLTKDKKVLESLKKTTSFVINFLHPNFTAGGEYMARNTEYLIPSGFVYLSDLDPNAKLISSFIATAMKNGKGLSPKSLDDRYISCILCNWLMAGLSPNCNRLSEDEYEKEITQYLDNTKVDRFFDDSGIRVLRNKDMYFTANMKKGGSFRVYFKDKKSGVFLCYFDSGMIVIDGGKVYSSGVIDTSCEVVNKEKGVYTSGHLTSVKESLMHTKTMLLFKTWQLLFGRLNFFQRTTKKLLRTFLITFAKKYMQFERKFTFGEKEIRVADILKNYTNEKRIYLGCKHTNAFIPSSKYFNECELESIAIKEQREEKDGDLHVVRTLFH